MSLIAIRNGCVAAWLAAVGLCWAVDPSADKKRPVKLGIKTPGIQIPMTSLKADADIALTGEVAGVVFADKVYVATRGKDGLQPIVTKTNKLDEPVTGLQKPCAGIVSAFGGVWTASCGEPRLSKFDTKAKKIASTIAVPAADVATGLVSTADSLWLLSDERTTLSRIDPEVARVTAEIRLPAGCNSLLAAEAALWITCPKEDKLLRLNTQTNLVDNRIEIAGEPVSAASGEGSIWVFTRREGKVMRIDPKTNKVIATIELMTPAKHGTIAFGEGAVWVSTPEFPLARIDPSTDKVAQQFAGAGGGALYFGAGSVWLGGGAGNTLHRYDPKRIRATLAE